MRLTTLHLVYTVLFISLLAGSAIAQDDYYYNSDIRYSDQLVAGMEFTWEISKYNIETPSVPLGLAQASTSTVTTTQTTFATSTTAVETITVSETYSEEQVYPDFPDIKSGTTITVKLLKNLANLTGYDYPEYDTYEDYQKYLEEFFEISYSAGSEEEMENFMPVDALISPNTIVFENGTLKNLYEVQYLEYQQYQASTDNSDFGDENGYSGTFEIRDGIAYRTAKFEDTENNFSNFFEIQYDIDTGLLVYVYGQNADDYVNFEIEIKLKDSKGININELVANDDPTLSVPFSVTFVYALILLPIVVNKVRKNS